MDDQVTPAVAQSSAARAFEDLRGEVSLLRRAIEGLAAERHNRPDYGPTLEAMAASNEQIRAWARKIDERPAVRLTPVQIGEQIEEAAGRFRAQDRQQLAVTQGQLAGAVVAITKLSLTARIASEQVRREKIVGGLGFLGGLLVWALLAEIQIVLR